MKIPLYPAPDPDEPSPDYTTKTQDMINISTFADPTTIEAESVCHLYKKVFVIYTRNGINMGQVKQVITVHVINKHVVKNNGFLNLNKKGRLA